MNAKLQFHTFALSLVIAATAILAANSLTAQTPATPAAPAASATPATPGAPAAPATPAAPAATATPATQATPAAQAESGKAADGDKKGQGKGQRRGPPLTDADSAEIAKLKDLPEWKIALSEGDYSTGPDYPAPPEQTVRENVPKGKIVDFVMDSADSKIFPGQTEPFKRKVAVYVPAQNKADTPAPFIVSCDQYGLNYKLSTILDNMIADKRLPPLVVVMVANAGRDRSYEYDTVSGKYAEFIESEVLPRVEKEAGIKLTKDPDARMTLGGSSGGICAFSMAWFHPELYHRVLSYSGTFVNLRNNPETAPHGGWEYPENFIAKSEKKPLRVWLHVGERDNGAGSGSAGMRNWVIANQRLATVLKAKGYPYQFVYAKNSGHTPGDCISNTLPAALEYVWRGYPIDGAK
jgi:iron(III)-enterobactin esterase